MSKFTKSPIKDEDLVGQKNAIEEFVKGALHKTKLAKNHEDECSWANLDDVEKTKGINLRITKADLAKLQHISKNTPYSIQGFCYENIKKAIENKLKELS
ncbi:MAG: hypothetical protein ACK4M7_02845 [Burkholderiales bacterium]